MLTRLDVLSHTIFASYIRIVVAAFGVSWWSC